MSTGCPNCGSKLRKRGENLLRNIRLREIENRYDDYVCPDCEITYSEEEIIREKKRQNGGSSSLDW